jgi:translation initiation factor IF-1
MAKENLMEFEGVVVDVLPNAKFKVKLQNGHIIIAQVSGKLRLNNIRVLLGDKVTVEVSVYDLTKGRIIWRAK